MNEEEIRLDTIWGEEACRELVVILNPNNSVTLRIREANSSAPPMGEITLISHRADRLIDAIAERRRHLR